MTYNGSVDAFMEPMPLIWMEVVEPACPELWVTCNPATLPFNAFSNEAVGTSLIASFLTTAAAPVYVPFLAVP